MFENVLEGIGLTNGEIKVYLTLLKVGETTTGKIIEESGLSSGKIYEILEKLMKKGLVTYIIKEKTKYFSAATPKKIFNYLSEKKEEIVKKREEVKKILPELMKLYVTKKEEYRAVIYKGIEGFKTALYEELEILKKSDEMLVAGVSLKRHEKILRFWDAFNKAKSKKGVKSKMIVSDLEAYEVHKKTPLTEIRLLETLSGIVQISISKNTLIIYNYADLSLIKIMNKDIAQSFREFFYNLWNIAKKIK